MILCLLQPLMLTISKVQTLNQIQREGRIRSRIEDEQVVHPNPLRQVSCYIRHMSTLFVSLLMIMVSDVGISIRREHLLRKIRIENAASIEHCAMNINLCIHGRDIVDGIISTF